MIIKIVIGRSEWYTVKIVKKSWNLMDTNTFWRNRLEKVKKIKENY